VKTPTGHQRNAGDVAILVARWLLGLTFLAMGLSKAWHLINFLKLLRAYELVQDHHLLNLLAIILPWLEVFCGGLLLAGLAVRGTTLILAMLLTVFTAVILHRALVIMSAQALPFMAVKFDCGCGAGEVLIWQKLLENLALFGLSLGLLLRPQKTR
jgi:uncharacterized membrane protein YphA (DoxX/SURF4 family)